jgi:hypothetical protein
VDPDKVNPNPDTAFQVIAVPDPELQEKPSALKSHLALQKIEFIHLFYFCGSLLPSRIWIWLHIPDQDPQHCMPVPELMIKVGHPS